MLYLGLLSQDTPYVDKLIRYLGQKHGAELSASGFSSRTSLDAYLSDHKLDVLLAERDLLGPDASSLAFPVGLLTDLQDAASIDGLPAVGKYQRVEQIYKSVLDLCASVSLEGVTFSSGPVQELPVIAVLGAAGGVGATTLGVACAKSLSQGGLRTLYLNLEAFSDFSDLLDGEGTATLSDVLYAIKSGSQLLRLKLESTVRRDRSGVWFYMPFQETMDFCSLSGEEAGTLLQAILSSGLFDAVVADPGAQPSPVLSAVLEVSRRVLAVTDGSGEGNRKLSRMLALYRRLDEARASRPLLPQFRLLYNRLGPESIRLEGDAGLPSLGSFPRLENASRSQVVQQLAAGEPFLHLMQDME